MNQPTPRSVLELKLTQNIIRSKCDEIRRDSRKLFAVDKGQVGFGGVAKLYMTLELIDAHLDYLDSQLDLLDD